VRLWGPHVQDVALRADELRSAGFRRVFALDPGLGPIPGHWATYARKLSAAFRARGLDVVLCGNRQQEARILDGLAVEPLFSLTPFERYGENPHDPPTALVAFERQVARFADDLEKLEAFGLSSEDLLIYFTVYPQILGGLIEWARRRPERRMQRVALLMQFAEEVNVYEKARGAHGDVFYIDYYRRIMPSGEGRDAHPHWRYFAASPGLGDLFSALMGKDVRPLPMPGSAAWPPPRRRAAGDPIAVALLGHTSIAKGGFLLPEIIEATLARYPNARFNLHLSTNPDTRELDARFAEGGDRLRILRGYISDGEIQGIIDASDIVLLPYAAPKYRLMPSAIFIQAVCSGKIVVLPAGSHMHRELLLRGGGGTMFHEHSAAAINTALWNAIEEVDRLSPLAAAAAAAHREVNSPDAYVKRILDSFA
jgi:glycosyltransferase involved in cell wall biosynthesis